MVKSDLDETVLAKGTVLLSNWQRRDLTGPRFAGGALSGMQRRSMQSNLLEL
jgi:hypothetical protein